MPNRIGFVDNTSMLAHYAMLAEIKDFCEDNGWTILRYDTAPANRELIMKAPGLSGTEEIFCGFRTYQDAGADYYNLLAGVFTGYVSSNTFDTQPAAMLCGVPAHNNRIDYWMTLNGQRLALAMRVGTPVYESAYVGKFLPYATPSQYPYPVVCAGMLSGAAATRFSETTHRMPYKGKMVTTGLAHLRMRDTAGAWLQPWCHPWGTMGLAGDISQSEPRTLRDSNNEYSLEPVVLHDNAGSASFGTPTVPGNVFGRLDGIHFISGFNNAVENTLTVDGQNYVVIQDVARTGFPDYYAMRLDT